MPNTTVPRAIAALLVLIGVAVTAGVLPVRAPQDFYGGLVLVMLATFALIASADLPGQRGFAFGPGTAPRLFAIILAGLGAAIALGGLVTSGPPIEKYKIRGPVLVIAAILGFSAMIRPLGLIIASYVTFIVSIMGSKEMRVVESLIGAAVMTAVLRGAVRLPAQPAVPTLAALLTREALKSCQTFSRTSRWAFRSRPTLTTSCSACSVRWSAPWSACCPASARSPPSRCCCRSPSGCRRSAL